MGTTKNREYGKPVKRAGVNKLKEKYDKAIEKAIEQESLERRKMNFSKEFEAKFPSIFEND